MALSLSLSRLSPLSLSLDRLRAISVIVHIGGNMVADAFQPRGYMLSWITPILLTAHTHTHHAHCLNIRLYFRFCKQKQNIFFSIFVVPSPHCLCCCCIFFLLFFFFSSSSLSQMSSRAEPLHLDELSVPVDCVDCVYLNVVFAKVKQSCL